MSISNRKNVYALTGNMGCGKSTVAEFLKKHDDILILDCDQISKDLLFISENKEKIEKILDDEIIKDGKIDKQKIAQIIFNNQIKKQKLEDFIYPKVWEKVDEEIENGDKNTIFMVESALIYETNKDKYFKKVIVVTCDEKEQFWRIKERNKWTDKEIKERLEHQISNKIKESKGLVVINTNCSLKELKLKTEKLYSYIKNKENYKLVL